MNYLAALARILTAGALIALAGVAAAQPTYPNKALRLIVPFPPGGSTNIVARIIGQKLNESLGQAVIVDNRGGGNTIIGTDALAKSAPDGYTLLFATSTVAIQPHLIANLPYDVFKDFAPVATLTKSEYILALHPSVPANNLQEFIALAKAKPGQLNYGTSGAGGPQNLAGELFNILAGVKIVHIPYKGGGPAFIDLIAGQVQLAFNNSINVLPHVKTGKLKAIAISGETRASVLPQVPTFTEAGLPGFDVRNWFGILLPAGTPRPIIDKLSAEFGRILTMADVRDKLDSQGVDPFVSSPEKFAALIKADYVTYGKVIKTANIKIDQ